MVIEFQAGLTPERRLTAVLALDKIMNLDLQLALESYASLSALDQAAQADRLNNE